MARPEGFEPPTPKFVVWCSIQLSYGRVPRQNVLARRRIAIGFRPNWQGGGCRSGPHAATPCGPSIVSGIL